MANTRTFNRSFSGGELSPEMFGRIDDVKFQTGAAKLRNFIVTPQGPVENRPGTKLVRKAKFDHSAVRLIPFTYNTTQTMVLEFGYHYIRFHTEGATLMDGDVPYEVVTPYDASHIFDIHYVQSADVVTLVHPSYKPMELRRLSAIDWALTEISFTSTVSAPSTVTVSPYMPASALAGPPPISADTYQNWDYVVTAISADNVSESSASAVTSVNMNLYITGAYNTIAWSPSSGAIRYRVYKKQGGIFGYIGQTASLSLVDDNIAPDTGITPPIYDNDFSTSGIGSVTVLDPGMMYGTGYDGGIITGVSVTGSGSGYTNPVLEISDPTGSGGVFALTTAHDGEGDYKVVSVNVDLMGSGYTAPELFVTDTTGSGAALSWTTAPDGAGKLKITSVTVEDGGKGYSATPSIKVVDATGAGAAFTVYTMPDGTLKITSVSVVYGGSGYTAPVVVIYDTTPGGTGSGASFSVDTIPDGMGGLTIAGVTVISGGSGYKTPVWFIEDPGTPVPASLNITTAPDGLGHKKIVGVTVIDGGEKYTDPIAFIVDSPSTGSGATFAVSHTIATDVPTLKVTDPTGTGAILRPIVTGEYHGITSVEVIEKGHGYTSPVVSVDLPAGGSGAVFSSTISGFANSPGAVSYFEQRRCFAGSYVNPQNIWMTKSGTESNMSYSLPIRDDDRIKFRVAAREANTIRHIVPLNQLILLTGSAEWRVSSVNSDAITPTSISVRPQSYIGASNVQPVIINNSLVYCAARGGHLRELGYSWQSNGFITGDVSLRAAHLFDTYEVVDLTYSKAPNPVVWCVSNSGKLLGLTYVPEQQVGAWHWHDTEGEFKSCAVVAEGDEDILYVVVKRKTTFGQEQQYIERMNPRKFGGKLEDAYYMDCGLSYDGTMSGYAIITGGTEWDKTEELTLTASGDVFAFPGDADINDVVAFTSSFTGIQYRFRITSVEAANTVKGYLDKTLEEELRGVDIYPWSIARKDIGGLDHLEGKTVAILGDGAVIPNEVVVGGKITLPHPCSKIHVGLPYQSDLQTLPMTLNIEGYGQGRYKNINKAWVRVFQSSGIFIGPDENNLVEAKQRTTEPYGSPPSLKSDEIYVMLTPTWASSGQIYLRQQDPLPLTLVGLTLEVAIGG